MQSSKNEKINHRRRKPSQKEKMQANKQIGKYKFRIICFYTHGTALSIAQVQCLVKDCINYKRFCKTV